MVRDLHAKLTKEHVAYVANRAIALVSAAYNKAIRQGELACPNPAAGVERNEEAKRGSCRPSWLRS